MTQCNKILDRVVLVKIEANIYGARKKLRKEDLVLADGSELPPEDLASLGSKRLLDPDELADFNRLKKAGERHCLRVGTRFMGGFVVPVEHTADIVAELEKIALAFATKKASFLAGYDDAVRDWIAKHPSFAGIIEKAIDPMPYVATKLGFNFMVVAIRQPEAASPGDVARLEQQIDSIGGQLFHEVAVDAQLLLEQSLIGKEQVTRNALRPIKRIRDKLDGLGFLDHRVAPIVRWIDTLLQTIPSRGAIEGALLQEILAMTLLLANPDQLRRHGEGLLTMQPAVTDDDDTEALEPLGDETTPVSPPAADPLQFSLLEPTAAPAIDPEALFGDLFDDLLTGDGYQEANDSTYANPVSVSDGKLEPPALAAQAPKADPEDEPQTRGNAVPEPSAKVVADFWF
ncbi:DUF3150 domain-containing protein [Methylomonas sp. UP202]|uniref:DUF3150 domain-containing protein n=1 Tax=Methylomonas sp. UP202 TaxID=3040943 RepID=UPI002478EB97|nr:DUF3150 domain-containing protein [Methylomonas sp. UP202]WGS83945.1 DUF3150 domain-containing protein [Methylomonas sp. UP202]